MSEKLGIDELDELDALRLENDTLRRNLQTLEEKVLCAEEHHAQSQAEKNPPAEFMRGKSDGGQSDPVELRRLNGILRWLHEAKADIAECDRSKVQLESDVCLLFDLLVRARKERRLFVGAVGRLEQTVASSDAKNVEMEREIDLQRRSLGCILRKDRNVYEIRTQAAETLAQGRAEELKQVVSWAERANSKYAEAFYKLSSQADEIGAANSGDLAGFARDMSEEVRQIRQRVESAVRPRGATSGTSPIAERHPAKKGAGIPKDVVACIAKEEVGKGNPTADPTMDVPGVTGAHLERKVRRGEGTPLCAAEIDTD